jgi:predicted ATPase
MMCFQTIILDVLRVALDESSSARLHTRYDSFLDKLAVSGPFLGELAEAFGHLGDVPRGLAALDRALDWTERTEGRWYVAELLRSKGELLLLQGAPNAVAAADDYFRRALDWARRQGALSWELRAATSLARLLSDRDRSADAWAVLQPVYNRFTEGFTTGDLKAAKELLDDLE